MRALETGREAIQNSICTLALLNDPRSRAAVKRVRSRRIQESFLHASEKCVRTKLFCVSPLALSYDLLPLLQVLPIPQSLAQLVHWRAHARLAPLFGRHLTPRGFRMRLVSHL